jgi:two-component system, NarL family, sensor histidine kinase UhpB
MTADAASSSPDHAVPRLASRVSRPAVAALLAFAVAFAAAGALAVVVAYQWHHATGAAAAASTILLAGAVAACAFAVLVLRLARHPARLAESNGEARLNEVRMMGIIRSAMEAIITIDETQTIIIFNPAAEFVFGVSAMDAVGSPLSRFIPEQFRAAHAKHVEQFGVTGVTERQMGHPQRVLYGLRANGEAFPIEASISQIRDVSGRLYTVMLRDITQRLHGENALKQSREELRELSANLQNVREAEKTRIARELHDDLGQQLTALKIDLSALEHALRNPSGQRPMQPDSQPNLQPDPDTQPTPEVAERVAGMRKLIDATVAAVRRIAADLRPVMLDDLGLVPAIEWLTTDFTQRYGIPVDCHIDTDGTTFSNTAATTLFRIVQEALTNVARHADATRVVLTLATDDTCCTVRVLDDGRGASGTSGTSGTAATDSDGAVLPVSHGRDKSFGLLGVRERAYMLGGTVVIDTHPGDGFTLTVTFPLKSLQSEETSP